MVGPERKERDAIRTRHGAEAGARPATEALSAVVGTPPEETFLRCRISGQLKPLSCDAFGCDCERVPVAPASLLDEAVEALAELTAKVEKSWPVLRDPGRDRSAAANEGAKLRRAAEAGRSTLTHLRLMTDRFRVTDPCRCGHQIIAHSTDGCVFCDCDKRHAPPPEQVREALAHLRTPEEEKSLSEERWTIYVCDVCGASTLASGESAPYCADSCADWETGEAQAHGIEVVPASLLDPREAA